MIGLVFLKTNYNKSSKSINEKNLTYYNKKNIESKNKINMY